MKISHWDYSDPPPSLRCGSLVMMSEDFKGFPLILRPLRLAKEADYYCMGARAAMSGGWDRQEWQKHRQEKSAKKWVNDKSQTEKYHGFSGFLSNGLYLMLSYTARGIPMQHHHKSKSQKFPQAWVAHQHPVHEKEWQCWPYQALGFFWSSFFSSYTSWRLPCWELNRRP